MSLDQLLAWIPPGSADLELARQIQLDRLPQHVAIIMDGNGRWAAGATCPAWKAIGPASSRCAMSSRRPPGSGSRVLTLYAFSVENWKRPRDRSQHADDAAAALPAARSSRRCSRTTSASTSSAGWTVSRRTSRPSSRTPSGAPRRTPACCSTSRSTTAAAPRSWTPRARAMAAGLSPDDLTERRFADFLYTTGQPDPDLLIRTSGEMRVSNFLLWQIAYAEIYVTETLLARLPPPPSARGDRRLPEARPPLRRHAPPVAAGRQVAGRTWMTRILSGVALAAAAVAAIWFLTPLALLGVGPRWWRRSPSRSTRASSPRSAPTSRGGRRCC